MGSEKCQVDCDCRKHKRHPTGLSKKHPAGCVCQAHGLVCSAEDCTNIYDVDDKPQRRYCSSRCQRRQNSRRQDRRRRYGVYGADLNDYDRLFLEQSGTCAICGTDKPGGAKTRFAFDHDHTTNSARGLLCYLCNVGLGSFLDDTTRLFSAIAYLNKHKGASVRNGTQSEV